MEGPSPTKYYLGESKTDVRSLLLEISTSTPDAPRIFDATFLIGDDPWLMIGHFTRLESVSFPL
jgi:hypothetical protein